MKPPSVGVRNRPANEATGVIGGIARYISPQSDRAYLGLLVEVESTWPTDGLRWLRADVGTEPMQF